MRRDALKKNPGSYARGRWGRETHERATLLAPAKKSPFRFVSQIRQRKQRSEIIEMASRRNAISFRTVERERNGD